MDGILIVNKPQNITSHDVVHKARKALQTKRIGHAGTLDPDATGVIVLCIGKATKLSKWFINHDKEYLAKAYFGIATDTFDLTGTITERKKAIFTASELDDVLNQFIGNQSQYPPMYSAIKVKGKKLYEYARKGKEVKIESRSITISQCSRTSDLRFLDDQIETDILIQCSKGTYIRSLVVDIGKKLDVPACLSGLVRTRSGEFTLSQAVSIEDIAFDHPNFIPLKRYVKRFPHVLVGAYLETPIKNGIVLDERQTDIKEPFIAVNDRKEPLALYEPIPESKRFKPIIIF